MAESRPRFDDRDEPSRWLRVSPVLVRCPRCGARAVATASRVTCSACGLARDGSGPLAPNSRTHLRLTGRCSRCGRALSAEWVARGVVASSGMPARCDGCGATTRLPSPWTGWVVTTTVVPTFQGLDVWLQTPCVGRILWAYDASHLDFLERYVAAGLREQAPGNSSLASRLPRWMKAARNRDAVGRGLARLRAMLTD